VGNIADEAQVMKMAAPWSRRSVPVDPRNGAGGDIAAKGGKPNPNDASTSSSKTSVRCSIATSWARC